MKQINQKEWNKLLRTEMNKQTRFQRGAPNHHRRRTKQGGHQDDQPDPPSGRARVGRARFDHILTCQPFCGGTILESIHKKHESQLCFDIFSQYNCGLGFPRQRLWRLEGGRVKEVRGKGKPHMQCMEWHIIATTGSELWLLTRSITSRNPEEKKRA